MTGTSAMSRMPPHQLDAVGPRQHQVQQHQVGVVRLHQARRLLRVANRRVTRPGERVPDVPERLRVVVHRKNARPLPLRAPGAVGEPGEATLDERTTLAGIPAQAWEYRLGNRSALEWVLDQYKERKPRDPTIREKFNTYRFSDHKEQVIDLLRRVCTVSVATMEIVDSMAHRELGERRGQAPGHGV